MMGKGVSREHFQPKTCSGKKENLKNIVFIDVDSDQVDDVEILDFSQYMSKLQRSGVPSRERVCTPQSVISIDDDDDEESDDVERPGLVPEGGGEMDSDASSSKRFSPESSGLRNSVHIDVDDINVCEKDSGSHMQKNKRASSTEGTVRNRYGLDCFESEPSESDSDCSDCELMEREQWEKFSVKKKRSMFNDQPCYDEHASSSHLHPNNNIHVDIDVKNRTERNAGGAAYSGATDGKYVKQNQSSFSDKGDSQVDGAYFNFGTENYFKDSDQKVKQGTFKSPRSESIEKMQSLNRSYDIEHGKESNFCRGGVTGASRFNNEVGGKESTFVNLVQDECERQVDNIRSAPRTKIDNFRSAMRSEFDKSSEVNSKCASVDERCVNCDGLQQGTSKSPRCESIEKMQSLNRSCDTEHGTESNFCRGGVTGAARFNNEVGGKESNFVNLVQDECEMQVDNIQSALRSKVDNFQSAMRSEVGNLADVNSNCACVDERHVNCDGLALNDQDCGLTASNERDIINEREKLKETDEYKQAMEEEWASRQQQLQIQAEEAQRLRKRRRAESQRLLEMQRRQKERIEEVRETQKKDEEFLNLKEQLRVEIRKELNNLEKQCCDMPSLLRGLGIHVGGSSFPLPHEVQAACKRALFKFHPDRASKTDIREQVEAEEKFKLISRMKEKFLSTSFH